MKPQPSSVIPALLLAGSLAAQAGGDTFGHARARELAELGRLPTAAEIVVRDLVNYHRHRLPLPSADQWLLLNARLDRDSAREGDEVFVQVGYATAPQGDRALAAPTAVALVVDVSGSMAEADKLAAVQRGLHAFADRLRADDEVALVSFSNAARVERGLQRRGDGRWLHEAIDRLAPEGSTNLHDGLMRGLDELGKAAARGTHSRLIVLTDGIANQGVTDPAQILADATSRAETVVDISTIGFGKDLDVALLQRLASGCRGLFHFVADGVDVQKVFVAEADALLCSVARDLHLAIELRGGLRLVQVLHEGARVRGNVVELDLPTANAGVTAVVLLRCRVEGANLDHAVVHATIDFVPVATGRPAAIGAMHIGNMALPRGAVVVPPTGQIDLEVRKTAAIAMLAQGLADMAVQCDARRWADAERALQSGCDAAQRLFPGQDEDVQRVRDLVAGHHRTLRRYLDRFRRV